MNPPSEHASTSHGRYGKLSLACAAGACLLLIGLSHIARLSGMYNGSVLAALEYIGWVNTGPSYIAQVKESSIFALHDANAVLWLTWFAFLLAYGAITLALYAEYRREPTLYSAAGFVVAVTSISLLQAALMLFTGVAGAGLLFAIRGERAARPS